MPLPVRFRNDLVADHEQHRRECEARYWLRRGYTTAGKISELGDLLRPKRGADGVEYLVEEMRRQWPRRREWQT